MQDHLDIPADRLVGQIRASGDTTVLRTLGLHDPERAYSSLERLTSDRDIPLPANLLRETAHSPDPDLALNNFERLAAAVVSPAAFYRLLEDRPAICSTLLTMLGGSSYLADIVVRDPEYFYWLTEFPERLTQISDRDYFDEEIRTSLDAHDDVSLKQDALRRLARRELLRIGTADLIDARPIHRIADELSDLADAILECVVAQSMVEQLARFGAPRHENGEDASFCVISLGKLGGQELNFSSDIDLMFVYSADGKTTGDGAKARSVTNQEFFSRLSERVIQVLTESSREGFLYRVDMRLRPDGSAGALTMPVHAYEAYYARRGELWERQMLIKARVSAGSEALGARFLRTVRPFIFPGHIDGKPVEEIRRIKDRIEGKIGKKGAGASHLKLRSGGIRDIEFVVQCLQLIVGQVHDQVRTGHTLEAIERLRGVGALSSHQSRSLCDAYLFFRRLEHRLQMMHGLSDYTLPEEEPAQVVMARSLGLASADVYRETLDAHLGAVRDTYDEVFSEGEDPGSVRSVATLCEIELGDPDAIEALREVGFSDPENAHRNLVYLAFGHAPRIRGTQARRSFMELGPALISTLSETVDPDQALGHLERLVSAYGAGNTFFQMLNANPGLRELILKLCAGSEFLIGILVRNPGLLDWLTLPAVLLRERNAPELEIELDRVLERVADPQQQIAALNGLKNREILRIGTRDLLGLADSFETFDALTLLAERILRRVHGFCYARLIEKWGEPRTADGSVCPFVILGLGKMGGRELNFGSDLDLVFVYGEDGQTDKGQGNLQFFVELCQGIVNDLGRSSSSGSLYEIDARLRPEGGSALLALSEEAYATYLVRRAKTWERLALSRSRTVSGDESLGDRLLTRFETFIIGEGFGEAALADMLDIRRRMEPKASDPLSIKTGPGGIVDVEFLVQIMQIREGGRYPELRTPNTREGLRRLAAAGCLDTEDASALEDHFTFLRTVEKVLRRQDEKGRTRLPKEGLAIRAIARAVSLSDADALTSELERRMRETRDLFNRYIVDCEN